MACSGTTDNKVQPQVVSDVPTFWPQLNIAVKQSDEIESKVSDLLAKLTLEQKVAQMIQPEIRDITVADMRQYGFGSYLNGGGAFPNNNKHATPADWVALAEELYQASVDDSIDGTSIPTMWGTDAVHGHNNVIGATLFPHNIGLGAAHNPELITEIASITAKEVMATGIDWVFAPTVAVVRDDRWGRTYEGYSEDPEIVKSYAAAIVEGLQGAADEDFLGDHQVISTVKHFIGDGGTQGGDDQGDNIDDEATLFKLHAQGYVGGLTAGAQSVMASFNSWDGIKNHGNKYLLTDVLKTRMGFDGFVVGDWNGHGQVKGCTNESCAAAVNAGIDILMVPTAAWKPLYNNVIAQVKSGEISMARIDDAVSRILRVKVRAGLFTKPSPANRVLSGKAELIGAKAHRDIARQAVRESLVLLKNKQHLLPLAPQQNILVAGDGADNIGKQSGGWSITWQGSGNTNADFPGGTSIYQGIKDKVQGAGGSVTLSVDGSFESKPDVAIVVFGEEPYAEGNGDLDNLEFQRANKKDLALMKRLKAQHIPVVAIFLSGRPMWVNAELNASDAFVAAWLPGSEGHGISDVIIAKANGSVDFDFVGKLSYSWPKSAQQTDVNRFDTNYQPLLPYGFGLTYQDNNLLTDNLNEKRLATTTKLTDLVMLQGTVKSPWNLLIGSASTKMTVNSNFAKHPMIQLRTVDKVIQEDARQLTFNGSGLAMFMLQSAFPQDLLGYVEAEASLSFAIKLESTITAPIRVGINCVDECSNSVDISEALAQSPVNSWQMVSIDLKCFSDNDVNFASVIAPFSLLSTGPAILSIADISVSPHSRATATVHCQ